MRFIVAVTAAVLALSFATSTPGFAQERKALSAEKRASLQESFNSCVSLARQRGYSNSDLEDNRDAARSFVLRCMRGGQQRAQKR